MKYKNYYKILDLKGPKVTEDEIKIAYRKLAKKYHPDVNPEAEEKFKNINEAWDTLSSKEKKKRYNIRYYMHMMQNGVDFSGIKDSLNKAGTSEFIKIFVGDKNEQKSSFSLGSIKEKLDTEVTISITLEEAFNRSNKENTLQTSW